MTTKEQYSLGNSADEWVDIPLKTFQEMAGHGYEVQYSSSGSIWVRPLCWSGGYGKKHGPFRAKRTEYMRYLNSGIAAAADGQEPWRSVCFEMGQQSDAKQQSALKSRPDLLPSKAVLAAGRVLAFGLSKHPDEKWKTLSVEDHVAAACRHLFQHQNGLDEETGESHLAHALCRIAFAIARSQGD